MKEKRIHIKNGQILKENSVKNIITKRSLKIDAKNRRAIIVVKLWLEKRGLL